MRLKGKGEQILWCGCVSSSKSVPVVILASQGNRSRTVTIFFCSRSWVPAGLLNTKMKCHTVSLEWKQHEVSMKRGEQYVKGNTTERSEQLTPGAEQICPFCFTVKVCFQLFSLDCLVGLTTSHHSCGLWKETIARMLFICPETSFTSCGKWNWKLNFKTSWKCQDAEMQSEAIQ